MARKKQIGELVVAYRNKTKYFGIVASTYTDDHRNCYIIEVLWTYGGQMPYCQKTLALEYDAIYSASPKEIWDAKKELWKYLLELSESLVREASKYKSNIPSMLSQLTFLIQYTHNMQMIS